MHLGIDSTFSKTKTKTLVLTHTDSQIARIDSRDSKNSFEIIILDGRQHIHQIILIAGKEN